VKQTTLQSKKLLQKARQAMKNAYAPYSGYKVGAALLTKTGKIFAGCNIENSSFGATACAERVAFYKAISEGEKNFHLLAVVASGRKKPVPCGICRQILWELAGDIEIVLEHGAKIERIRLSDLYPDPF
jgi:cytidine deaminase